MDVFRAVMGALGCINNLFTLIEKNNNRAKSLGRGLKSIKIDFETMSNLRPIQGKQLLLQPPGMQLLLQELSCDIDDFIQDLWVPDTYGSFILSATGIDPRPELIERTKEFRERIKTLSEELKSLESTTGTGSATPARCPSSAGSLGYAPEKDLVGIAKPKQEIVDLLFPRDGPLRVISIVGCTGVGKTALARAVYEDEDVVNKFDYKSWVVASDHNPASIVEKIREELNPAGPARKSTSESLQHISIEKRYLVIIDDVLTGGIEWNHIEDAFCENNMGSRIVLTTRVSSIAAAYSPGTYMYTMKCLGEPESSELFWRTAKSIRSVVNSGMNKGCLKVSPDLVKGSEDIILKCGGLPQALISAGKYLSKKGRDLKRDDCEGVAKGLGGFLEGHDIAFEEMKRALVQCYDNLPDYNHLNCLLYVSIFPRGHQIDNQSLVRKLLAEELVAKEYVHTCLDELIDRSLIEKVHFRDDSKVAVRRCKVHSIMLEFTIKRAVSRNFLSIVQEGEMDRSAFGFVRRLTVHSGHEVDMEVELSSLRSLTIFDNGILDFRSCRMMRVLDLEGCSWLNNTDVDAVSKKKKQKTHLDAICKLVFLKYLSLRNTGIITLPKEVQNLKCLETLDIRETGVETLPLQVIILPQLAFLFGRFEVPQLAQKDIEMLEKFLKKESKLHTIAGIVINGTQSFETITLHARRLEKVKIWFKWDSSIALRLAGILVSSLQNRLKDDLKSLSLDSVSVDFNGLSYDFLSSVQATCAFTSIKLRRNLAKLPEPAMLRKLSVLRKLQLFSTSLSIEELAVLQNLEYLEYLKLAEDQDGSWDGEFLIQDDGFPSLHLLCLEAPKLPKVIFEQGSMPSLNSLQLLCPRFPPEFPRGVEDISHLANLNEVILHHSAPDATVKAWKDAAKIHVNRPYVKQPGPNSNAL